MCEKCPPCAGVLLSVSLSFHVGPEHLIDPRLEALAALLEERHHIAVKPQRDLFQEKGKKGTGVVKRRNIAFCF